MPNGDRERVKRFVVRGTMDALSILEADCYAVDGGAWLVRAGCCTSLVQKDDAHKLYKTRAEAEAHVAEIQETGDFDE